MKTIDQKYRIVASAPNSADVVDLLAALTNEIADIRTPLLKQGTTIEGREIAILILTSAIDRLRTIANNERQRSSDPLDEDS